MTAVLNKEAIVSEIAASAGLKKVDAEKAFDAALGAIAGGLKAGKDVRLTNIGTLKVSTAAARKCRNPKTGEEVNVPARNVVKFSVSKELAEGVNA